MSAVDDYGGGAARRLRAAAAGVISRGLLVGLTLIGCELLARDRRGPRPGANRAELQTQLTGSLLGVGLGYSRPVTITGAAQLASSFVHSWRAKH